jgi:hypothetical protein
MARLTSLERERAEIVAEINALRPVQNERTAAVKVPSGRAGDPTDRHSPIEKKIALFRRLFRGRSDVFPHPVGESHDGAERLRTRLCLRMAPWDLREAESQMFGMSESGIPARR